ncbi:MAG: tail fiber domain-containing protein, partial [Bacteroidia bacterium]
SSNGDFALKNSGATGLSLSASKSTGNIGIGGIPSLSKTLLIYGSTEVFGQLKSGGMEVSGVLKVTGGAGQPGAGKVFTSDANGSGSWEMPGTWNLNGNSSTNGSNFIGTIDNVNFQVKTKNLLRMTVTAGGRVCIGNSLPGFKLDVQGGSINTDSLYRVDGEQVLNRDSLNLKSLTADAKIIIDRGSTGSIAIVEYRTQSGTSAWQTGTTSVDGNFIIKSTGAANQSSIMISKSTGNIGIGGIPSGSRILNVNGAAEINGPLTADGMEVNGILKVNGGAGSPVPGNVLTSDGTGTGTCSWQTPINGGGATNRIAFWKNATSLSSSSNLFWDSTNFRLGIGTGVPAFQLELSTNSAAKPTSSAWTVSSDARLKKDVADFNDGLELIKKIHPIWFNYNGEAGMPTDERGVGTLAQDLQKLAPYMVKEWTYININGEKQNYLGVDYGAMDFILVNAIKEQQQQMDFKDAKISLQQKDIDDLKTKFEAMENALSQCCMSYKSVVGTDGDREESGRVINNSVAKLEQNIPNPFTENSVIKFYIPQNSKNAAIKIYALDGTELKIILVSSKGFGQTQISGKTFAAGTYTYLLVVDGKVVDTKQFILTK